MGLALVGSLAAALIWATQPEPPAHSIPTELEPRMTYEIIQRYPHDPAAFTQGLLYRDGYLYESTGLYGESSLRKVALETGEVLEHLDLPATLFGEGLADWGERLVQLTWREGTGLVYDLQGFTLLGSFTYDTEGWGLTRWEDTLVMSDGTAALTFLDPETLAVQRAVTVMEDGVPVTQINELETVRGEVFANIWQTDEIVRIDPETGVVLGRINLDGLLPAEDRSPETDVLNGMAYDAATDRLFVTGKRWPALFEIRLVPLEPDV